MFNAIQYTQELEKAGFTRRQAEATLNMLYQFVDQNLATKTDILELKHSLTSDMMGVKNSIENLEYRMTIKMGGMLALAVALLAALQKLL